MIDENKLKLWAIDLQKHSEYVLSKNHMNITITQEIEHDKQYELMNELLNKLKEGEFNHD